MERESYGPGALSKPEDIIKLVRKSGAQKVKVAITDLDGVLRGKYIHLEKFLSAAESGFGFCNVVFGWDAADVCYDNASYTGWHSGYPDAKVSLDLSTCRTVPWDSDVPFILGEFVDEQDRPLAICPRQLLKQISAQAEVMGYFPFFGTEFEWFNFDETPQTLADKQFCDLRPLTPGMFGYSVLRSGYRREFFNDLQDSLREFDVPLEGIHTETGPGVYEAAITATDAVEAADRGVLFKSSVKEIAYRHNAVATFMARWHPTLPGCSGHIHQSLRREQGDNAFHDPDDPHRMSPTFKHYVAGIMHCLPEILPMFAPTVNSYKRLVEGYWAPTRVTWGVDNRTTALRIIPGGVKSTRLELRVGGADLNPYLAISASLAAGLYGIENKIELTTDPYVGNAYESRDAVPLPADLRDATQRFAQSKISRELFGEAFVEHFAASREWEWRQYQNAITDWELRRYFEII